MNRPATLLAIALVLVPLCLISYRIIWLGYPIFPVAPGKAWQLSMNAFVEKTGSKVQVEIGIPVSQPNQTIINEEFISGALQFNLLYDPPNRAAVWSEVENIRREIIGYRLSLLTRPGQPAREETPELGDFPRRVNLENQILARRLVAKWSDLEPGGRLRAIAATVRGDWGDPVPDEADLRAWATLKLRIGPVRALLVLLRAANLPGQPVEGLLLTENVRMSPLQWVKSWTGSQWESINPDTGEFYPATNRLMPLVTGEKPVIRVKGARLTDIRWGLRRSAVNRWDAHFERIRQSEGWLDHWSLFNLPLEFQETFRILLLVPIGALLVSILRNVVGFTIFGTFMPVLMAIAFRNTGIAFGLGIFFFIIGTGYILRRAMDPLRLLLVPRLSLLLTLVIAGLTGFANLGSKIGVQEFMAVGLLPIVILTMVIERFFVTIEEAGAIQGFQAAAGSAVVALIVYALIQWDALQLTFFVYPELIYAVAAGQVLLGRYTGFRLSEVIRFRQLRKSA